MNASLTVVAADIILDAVAVGLFLFALVFFFYAYRSLADETYLSIFLICAATMAYCALGLLVFANVLGRRDAALASILVRLQDLCLPLFFSFIPYFWSSFLSGRPRLAAALKKASFAGLAASALIWAIAFALPSLYIDGFRFAEGRLVYRLGPLYYAMQVPYLACLLGSL
ncbi:MAG: hypothetical protein Q8M76_00445, partial [Spirochaetaceae bacterium]|nr:hypothetical protein [Spirochaetaceae bacterium]